MNYLLYYGIMLLSALLSIFAFSQIFGAFRTRKERPLWKLIFTIICWALCMGAVSFLIWWFFMGFQTATFFGYGLGLIVLIFFRRK